MFDRELEFAKADPHTKMSMILSNYYQPPEGDFWNNYNIDVLEIQFLDLRGIWVAKTEKFVPFTPARIKHITKYRTKNYGSLIHFFHSPALKKKTI